MQIAEKHQERSTVIIIVLTLVVIGVSLLFSTWQTLKSQEESGNQHFFLTARSVYEAIEMALRWDSQKDLTELQADETRFFSELEKSEDLLFVGLMNSSGGGISGGRILTPQSPEGSLALSQEARASLAATGEWHGPSFLGQLPTYIYSKRISPDHEPPPDPMQIAPPKDNSRDVFLVVGIDTSKHLALYRGFRQNAFFQGLYIMVAAILTFALAMNFLSRRELAGRALGLERFQASLLDNLPDGLLTVDAFGVIQAANPSAVKILGNSSIVQEAHTEASTGSVAAGQPRNALIGKNLRGLPQELAACLCPPEDDALEGGISVPPVVADNAEDNGTGWRQCSMSGFDFEILSVPLGEDGSEGEADSSCGEMLIIIRDRTRLKALEKSLTEAEKLAAVGTLAAGVAHEIRNPLSALRGFAQLFAKKMSGKEPEQSYADTMVREADRLNRVVTDLLFLSKPTQICQQWLDLPVIAGELETLTRLELAKQGLSMRFDLKALKVFADQDTLRQALLNLVLNSLDAICGAKTGSAAGNSVGSLGGEDTALNKVCTGQAELVIESEAAVHDNRPGIWVRVRDHGPGLAPELLEQAFKPFFSTKGKGTGLGLALVERGMREHGGVAVMESSPGQGTMVGLFFPDQPVTQRPDCLTSFVPTSLKSGNKL